MVHAYVVVRCCVTLPRKSIVELYFLGPIEWVGSLLFLVVLNGQRIFSGDTGSMRTIGIVILGDFSVDLTDGLFSSKALSCDGHHFRLHQTKHEAISSLIDTFIQSHTVIIHCHYTIMTTYNCHYPPKQRNQTSFTYRIQRICSFTYTFSQWMFNRKKIDTYTNPMDSSLVINMTKKHFRYLKNGGILLCKGIPTP